MEKLTHCPDNIKLEILLLSLNPFFHHQSSWLLYNGTWWRTSSKPTPQNLHQKPACHPSSMCPSCFATGSCNGPMNLLAQAIHSTAQLIQHKFLWPSLTHDVQDVKTCATCTQSHTRRQLTEGLLERLPIPRRSWSHLSTYFLTDLPDSHGFTAVTVIIDRFSKACKLIPLKGLPTAMETANTLFHHVFRNYGLPEDIVSDRGPQFMSRVW